MAPWRSRVGHRRASGAVSRSCLRVSQFLGALIVVPCRVAVAIRLDYMQRPRHLNHAALLAEHVTVTSRASSVVNPHDNRKRVWMKLQIILATVGGIGIVYPPKLPFVIEFDMAPATEALVPRQGLDPERMSGRGAPVVEYWPGDCVSSCCDATRKS